jgi:pimeloyl-ACP methyl ester carboxylesterase
MGPRQPRRAFLRKAVLPRAVSQQPKQELANVTSATAIPTYISSVARAKNRRDSGGIRQPPWFLQAAETRAVAELGAFWMTSPIWRFAPQGDGHPVLVMPGFMASDQSTQLLRGVLASRGFDVHGWSLGVNVGPSPRIIDGITNLVERLHATTGREVSLVGWSLGGLYAREIARTLPHAVRQVITMGSPFRMTAADRSSVSDLFDELNDLSDGRLRANIPESERPPLTMPSSAIYSRTDGVVRWHTCIDVEDEHRENIEIRGSHCGLGWNPSALYAVVDRLAQPVGSWSKFRPPLALAHLYPRAVSWQPKVA